MKTSVVKKILLESVREVVKEDNINLDEIDFGGMFKYTPPTDEQIDAYLRSRPKDKAVLDKDPERKAKWIEFIKSDKAAGKALKNKEVVFAVWDPNAKVYKGASGSKSISNFGENKENESKYFDKNSNWSLPKIIKWIDGDMNLGNQLNEKTEYLNYIINYCNKKKEEIKNNGKNN